MLKPSLAAQNRQLAPVCLCSTSSPSPSSLVLLPSVQQSRPLLLPAARQHRCSPRGRRQLHRLISCEAVEQAEVPVVTAADTGITIKATVTVKISLSGIFAHMGFTRALDDIGDLLGKTLLLELVSSELDPRTGEEKRSAAAYAHSSGREGEEVKYEAKFAVPEGFGQVGAVLVENEHHTEIYLEDIVLVTTAGHRTRSATIVDCYSWVHSKFDNPEKRVFFARKLYLPSKTPKGLKRLRQAELETLRGDGEGERKKFERIYDYDTYNDIGNPDESDDLKRPVLGGSKELPYPRRCRTGRAMCKTDPRSEAKSNGTIYVPRDEMFSEVKGLTFQAKTLRSVFHALLPSIEITVFNRKQDFPHFTAIDLLFKEGIALQEGEGLDYFRTMIPRLLRKVEETTDICLQFEVPEMIHRDKFSWFRDEEFARQTIAGVNPLHIQLVQEFPLVSKLDPEIYGPPESLITEEIIEREIKGVMTVKEAIAQKKIFILDYHDVLLPFVHKVRQLEGTTLYGSRTILFLTPDGTLRPIAIELTRPASPTQPQWKQVFTHCWNPTGSWLWKLAKAHVLAHDSGCHQLLSHWLRTHCSVEPYIIAANRQLSAMHPIYRLLHPHFRYTMEINALAREYLIVAGGTIETCFSPGKYSMELCSSAYDKLWRFDMEGLPADLIRRGMAVEDPSAEHGLKLAIEDYPYANDGLLIWDAIKQWATDYVGHYYPTAEDVAEDDELQGWWTEVRTKGHADKKDEPWWPELRGQEELVQVLTTIMWVASGHHAAVNFGQYHYGGYFPNRPAIARRKMPVEDGLETEEFARFREKPEEALLDCFPTQIQATVVMAVLDILSAHSEDEEYLGQAQEPAWDEEPVVTAAFERFAGRMKEIEGIIDARNADPRLMNRCGAGIVPYELLKPFSQPGVTGMGIPNSISI